MASNGSDPAPLIGLTTYQERARFLVWDTESVLLQRGYTDSVVRAGGVAVLLPPQQADATALVDRLDGLVLAGGADLDPARYGEPPHPQTTGTRPERDEWETRLLRLALERDLPVLAVCRGAQVLNVVLGGTLRQHLPEQVGTDRHRPAPGAFGTIPVRLRAGSRLAAVIGENLQVACYHHQALGRVAADLDVVGWADDGTPEAVELPGHRFVVGVQWHPEQDSADVRLFQALVAAARPRPPAQAPPEAVGRQKSITSPRGGST